MIKVVGNIQDSCQASYELMSQQIHPKVRETSKNPDLHLRLYRH